MRRILCLMLAFALAMLPVGGMARVAYAAQGSAHADCHGPAKAAAHAVHDHHDHAHAAVSDTSARHAVPAASKHACPVCGPDCNCIGACGAPHAGLAAEAMVGAFGATAGSIAPAASAEPASLVTRPWPPPPRA